MGGDDDFCVSPSMLRALADLIPDATVDVVEQCGHLPFFENVERFEQSLGHFVRSVEARTTASSGR